MVTSNYMHVTIDYAPFYEKPPLFLWLQAASMHIFGVNAFAARFPNAIIGIISLATVFTIGSRYYNRRVGLLWAGAMAGSILPHFYFRSGIIDPLFNLCIFLGIISMQGAMQNAAAQQPWLRRSIFAGILTGLAVLTKGPVGWGLVCLTTAVAWLVMRKQFTVPWKQLCVMSVVTAGVTSIWLGLDLVLYGPTFMMENVAYQWRLLTTGDAGHEQPWYYHLVVVMIGCFPSSLFAVGAFRADPTERTAQQTLRIWMITLMIVVLVVFSAVKTKIIHYSSLTYLPLTFLAAVAIERRLADGRWSRLADAAILVVGIAISAAAAAVPYAFAHPNALLELQTFRDTFLRSAITLPVAWNGYEPLVALILFAGVVAFFVIRRKRPVAAIATLFSSVAVFIWMFLPTVAPKIERHTQGAMISFYESLRGKDVYVKPLTMKSYAHLFYTEKPRHLSATALGIAADAWEPWLLDGPIDRDAYFVAKINDAARWREHPQLDVLREEGGYVMFKRRR